MTQVDGIPVTFVMKTLRICRYEKPQKYSVGEAKEFLKKYRGTSQETEESIDTILEEEGKDASDDTSAAERCRYRDAEYDCRAPMSLFSDLSGIRGF